ncbi:MAG: outer membrane lipoprotein carrier protein LolA [Thermodesulfovibrionales bacterium]|nr:outer membrane lipoprotein carrier protein LolA [Thermodesulfovibrionales bacterium]
MRLIIVVLLLLTFTSEIEATDPVSIINDFYKSLQTIQGNFIQKSTIKELKKTMTYNGRFYMKKGSLHIRYQGEKPHLIYINNNEMIIYKPAEKTAYKTPFDETKYGQTPIALISGLTDIKSDFNIKKISEKRLSLTPLKGMGQILNVDISINEDKEFPIESISMTDKVGNKIDVVFRDIVVNKEIDSKIFNFVAPHGITILQ